jgi:hypothetical protein
MDFINSMKFILFHEISTPFLYPTKYRLNMYGIDGLPLAIERFTG